MNNNMDNILQQGTGAPSSAPTIGLPSLPQIGSSGTGMSPVSIPNMPVAEIGSTGSGIPQQQEVMPVEQEMATPEEMEQLKMLVAQLKEATNNINFEDADKQDEIDRAEKLQDLIDWIREQDVDPSNPAELVAFFDELEKVDPNNAKNIQAALEFLLDGDSEKFAKDFGNYEGEDITEIPETIEEEVGAESFDFGNAKG